MPSPSRFVHAVRASLLASLCIALSTVLEPDFAAAKAAASRRPMTVEDLWAMQRVGSPTVSPDGRWVAFTVTTYSMTENKGQGDLWLVETNGKTPPRRLTSNKGADTSPAWSRDGQRLAAFRTRLGSGAPVHPSRSPAAGRSRRCRSRSPTRAGSRTALTSRSWLRRGRPRRRFHRRQEAAR
jgi:dipeptidyl aminopeptidase/acylaminoacyl peptidase